MPSAVRRQNIGVRNGLLPCRGASTPKLYCLFLRALPTGGQTKRGGRSRPFSRSAITVRLRRRRLLGRPLLHRAGVLAARIDVAVDELDDAHRRAVAMAVASLEHARVSAAARGVAWAEHVKQLFHHWRIAQLGERLTARMQIATLCQ